MEVNMTRRKMMFAVAIGIATFGSCYATWTAQTEDDAALIKALGGESRPTARLTASQRRNTISANLNWKTASRHRLHRKGWKVFRSDR
jgi:hypothetical protein